MQVTIFVKPVSQMLHERGLLPYGKAQTELDKAILSYSAPYVPYLTGALLASGDSSDIGSGTITYTVPYAKKQYYDGATDKGMRGRLWFARMKADRCRELLSLTARACGGEAI